MALMTASTALLGLGLREVIKAILPGTKYVMDDWVSEELMPTLNSVATQIEGLHADIHYNKIGDHATRVVLSVLVATLVMAIVVMGVWIRDTRKTVSCLSQGRTIISSEIKICPSECFPLLHY